MGHGIAQVAAAAGYDVIMRDVNSDALDRGRQSIARNLAKAIQLGKISEEDRDEVLRRIHCTTQIEEIRVADLVIEAAPENLELKQNLLREVEALVDKDCVFATNTSSLSISEVAAVSTRPENVIGMHFFNPVH
ncbi:MAG: 3-hydroxyacyl-CoA dehydrogenase family protein, partial [Pyrinomonadaceae bacterium]